MLRGGRQQHFSNVFFKIGLFLANQKYSVEFTGDLVVRIWCFYYHGLGSVPGWGTKILQAVWHSWRKERQYLQHQKAVMKYYLTPIRMYTSKSIQIISDGVGMEEREPSHTVGRNTNWYSHSGKQYRGSFQN